jgi:hypothetical protein
MRGRRSSFARRRPGAPGPRFLIRDNDDKFGPKFEAVAKGTGIERVSIVPQSPNRQSHLRAVHGQRPARVPRSRPGPQRKTPGPSSPTGRRQILQQRQTPSGHPPTDPRANRAPVQANRAWRPGRGHPYPRRASPRLPPRCIAANSGILKTPAVQAARLSRSGTLFFHSHQNFTR